MDAINALSNIQASTQNYASNIASNGSDISSIVGLNQNQNQFATMIKVVKMNNDMERQIVSLIDPNRGNNVNMVV